MLESDGVLSPLRLPPTQPEAVPQSVSPRPDHATAAIAGARNLMTFWWGAAPAFDVLPALLPPELAAYVIPASAPGGRPVLVVSVGAPASETRLDEIRYHAFYAGWKAQAPASSPWLAEAFAVWALDKLSGPAHAKFIEAPSAAAWSRGIGSWDIDQPADPAYLFYLDQMLSPAVLARSLAEAAADGAPALEVLERVTAGQTPFTMTDLLPRFSLWTLQRGPAMAARDFPQGALWPDAPLTGESSALPASLHEGPEALRETGIKVFSLRRPFAGAATALRFEGRGASYAVNAMVKTPGGGWEWLPLSVDAEGRGALLLPAPMLSPAPGAEAEGDIFVSVLALGVEEGMTPSFRLTAGPLSGYPVRLQWGGAKRLEGRLIYEWVTESEENVFGWRPWMETASGERRYLTVVPVPSPGFYGKPFRYRFEWEAPSGGAPLTFGVSVLTRDGLPQDIILGRETPPARGGRRQIFP